MQICLLSVWGSLAIKICNVEWDCTPKCGKNVQKSGQNQPLAIRLHFVDAAAGPERSGAAAPQAPEPACDQCFRRFSAVSYAK